MSNQKIVIYQVFTRLFGNEVRTTKPWGTKTENGCGKMDDFTPYALQQIVGLGATHIWYTGLLEHATQTDYSHFGIRKDHPGVVKGIAGSPYAIKDYYDIDPDLATSVPARMNEFEALVKRTKEAGLKIVIDFVPNHVTREYHSDAKPDGVRDLGEDDNKDQSFSTQNNFYYKPGESLHATDFDIRGYWEYPARATGNDVFSAWVSRNDWYETIKLNYGVDYQNGHQCHFDPIPSTWNKMLDVLLFWSGKGVDAFRCDMAEMVPVEFWGWAIRKVKDQYPHIIFIAEVYNPAQYRKYIHEGLFDYLYDKVGLYDTLRNVICGNASATEITRCWQSVDDIREHMLAFLENHDEQRLASEFFAGNSQMGRAPLIVASCMGTNPMMIYFGQELGERGMDEEGFSGRDGRTSIFDYWTVDKIRRWRNQGQFNNRKLTPDEVSLQQFYSRVLHLCNEEEVLREGEFYDLMYANLDNPNFNPAKQYAFIRRKEKTLMLIVANFDNKDALVEVKIPKHIFEFYRLKETEYIKAEGLLTGSPHHISFSPNQPTKLLVPGHNGRILKFTL